MGLFDGLGEKGGAALGLEIAQALRAALDQLLWKRHVVTISNTKLQVGAATVEIASLTVTYEAQDK